MDKFIDVYGPKEEVIMIQSLNKDNKIVSQNSNNNQSVKNKEKNKEKEKEKEKEKTSRTRANRESKDFGNSGKFKK